MTWTIMPFLMSLFSSAEARIKVLRSRGGKAVIVTSDRRPLIPGETYLLVRDNRPDRARTDLGGKIKTAGVNFSYSQLSGSLGGASFSSTQLQLSGRYGRNLGKYEWGGFLSIENQDVDGGSAENDNQLALIGGYADYNLSANNGSANSVSGFRGEVGYGISDRSQQSKSGSALHLFGALIYKWFGLTSSSALTGELGFLSRSGSAGASESGFLIRAGLQTYF